MPVEGGVVMGEAACGGWCGWGKGFVGGLIYSSSRALRHSVIALAS